MRWLVAGPVLAAAGIGATACTFQMLLCAAYGFWGYALLYCMGLAGSILVGWGGWAILRFR